MVKLNTITKTVNATVARVNYRKWIASEFQPVIHRLLWCKVDCVEKKMCRKH